MDRDYLDEQFRFERVSVLAEERRVSELFIDTVTFLIDEGFFEVIRLATVREIYGEDD